LLPKAISEQPDEHGSTQSRYCALAITALSMAQGSNVLEPASLVTTTSELLSVRPLLVSTYMHEMLNSCLSPTMLLILSEFARTFATAMLMRAE